MFKGFQNDGPFNPLDGRVPGLLGDMRRRAGTDRPFNRYASNPARTAEELQQDPVRGGEFVVGMVVMSVPTHGWTLVQTGPLGRITCMTLGVANTPDQIQSLAAWKPNQNVLVWMPPASETGYIVGSLPNILLGPGGVGEATKDDLLFQGWATPGGAANRERDRGLVFPFQYLRDGGDLANFGGRVPRDYTGALRGWWAPSGLRVTIGDHSIAVAVNELAGLFLSRFDDHVRLAGRQLVIGSGAYEDRAGNDEGELYREIGEALYAHERLGMFARGVDITQANDEKEVLEGKPVAPRDLKEANRRIQPFHRWREFGGYLGQGKFREMRVPPSQTGPYLETDERAIQALFRETITPDGDYTLLSAKGIHIGRRVRLPSPHRKRRVDSSAGDDAAAGNYRHAGTFGDAEAHRVGDIAVAGTHKSLRTAAGVHELLAHACNWKALHAFHYHKEDWRLPDESGTNLFFARNQEPVDYAKLAKGGPLPDPASIKIRIDPRYGEVGYTETESYLRLLDDGGVAIGDGSGCSDTMTAGTRRIDAPGDVILAAGRTLVLMADQVILRSRGSTDISSAKGDVRLKAEGNMHMLAGNSGTGSLLLESRGIGDVQLFKDKRGEDVRSSGIILKAADSTVSTISKSIYLRSVGGDVIVDADRGSKDFHVHAAGFDVFSSRAVAFYYGPKGLSSKVDKVYEFGKTSFTVDVSLRVGKDIVAYGTRSDLLVSGSVRAAKNISAGGAVSSKAGGELAKTPPEADAQLASLFAEARTGVEGLAAAGVASHKAVYVDGKYKAGGLGDNDNIPRIAFSYRDASDDSQYRTAELAWPQARWQRMAADGTASGGVAWEEPAVAYQGAQLQPWPGRAAWSTRPVFHASPAPSLVIASTGDAADRPGPYENPQLAAFRAVPLSAGLQLTVTERQ